eukprot:TRINITY_DN7155_c0_g1_i1.p1 TRINITY_DN7155_c0_g1~~TRINITY_DN7155_c0_g1_i1.p1  ORF type:complete len:345 (-),score=57.49 TRINITY_DN7155_c0_g1_i1:58-1092(-)
MLRGDTHTHMDILLDYVITYANSVKLRDMCYGPHYNHYFTTEQLELIIYLSCHDESSLSSSQMNVFESLRVSIDNLFMKNTHTQSVLSFSLNDFKDLVTVHKETVINRYESLKENKSMDNILLDDSIDWNALHFHEVCLDLYTVSDFNEVLKILTESPVTLFNIQYFLDHYKGEKKLSVTLKERPPSTDVFRVFVHNRHVTAISQRYCWYVPEDNIITTLESNIQSFVDKVLKILNQDDIVMDIFLDKDNSLKLVEIFPFDDKIDGILLESDGINASPGKKLKIRYIQTKQEIGQKRTQLLPVQIPVKYPYTKRDVQMWHWMLLGASAFLFGRYFYEHSIPYNG